MANEKISDMNAAGPLTGAELVELVQGGDNVQSTAQDLADLAPSQVADAINDGVTDIAPSQNAVFDALAGKANTSHTHVAADVTDFDAAAKAAAVEDALANGVLDVAPSQNAVFDALAGKANTSHTHVAADVTDFDAAAKAAAVADAINDGVTDIAPSQNAVFDALATKQPLDAQLTSVAALSYASNALKVVRVNAGETDFELATVSGGATTIDGLTDAYASTPNNNVFLGDGAGVNLTPGTPSVFNGTLNTAVGINALNALTQGYGNTAVGNDALKACTTGPANVAVGQSAALNLTTGTGNTVVGYTAGEQLSTGCNNNAFFGYSAGNLTTTGDQNTFIGQGAGQSNTTGSLNICIGSGADSNGSGTSNYLNIGGTIQGTLTTERNVTLPGTGALKVQSGTTAQRPASPVNGQVRYNTDTNKFEAYENGAWTNVVGATSLDGLSDANTQFGNLFLGNSAGAAIQSGGNGNVGIGEGALAILTTGDGNLAIGSNSGNAITTGENNILIGAGSFGGLDTGIDNILIGNSASASSASASSEFSLNNVFKGTLSGEKNFEFNATGALKVHSGTAAQRPAAPVNGQIRYNTDTDVLEAYIGGTWKTITAV